MVAGKTLFDYADELRMLVPSSCGRTASCHECIVEVQRGMDALSARGPAEEFLRGDYRLACQSIIEKPDVEVVFAPLRRRPRILTEAREKPMELDPLVTRRGATVLYDGDPLDEYRGRLYGIAMDLGTTTIALELVDLESGATACLTSFENPQRFGGSDVMHRISYDGGKFRGELHKAVVNALNSGIQDMCRRLGFTRQEIYEIVVAGNSTMRDLFFGFDVQSIGQRPYQSVIEHEYRAGTRQTTSVVELAHRLGVLAHPKARIFGPPLVASHVGADTAADLVAIDAESHGDVFLLVDVGTNTEVVAGNGERMLAASCPAGPAFEGGLIKYGMTGCEGAIESLRWNQGAWEFGVIGDGVPQGICGSGLIDLLAELRRHGRMSPKGVFAGKAYELTIVPEQSITFSREDASNLAQAKAANYCGQYIVLRKFGIAPGGVSRVYLAGAFANYINVRNAIDIGFLAPVPEDRIVKIGNAALQGAKEMLLSRRKRQAIERLVKRIEHVELETTPDFFEVFVEGCQFKPMESTV